MGKVKGQSKRKIEPETPISRNRGNIMGAYGNYHTKTCPYCNSPHDELELKWKHSIHECDIQVLKNKIDQLRDEKKESLTKYAT